jgi:NAD(P)-dependent dehydrogenase (short-subunit alcohol dehydrogenase family)
MIHFEGKKALVTGGTRGIGRAIAERLNELGAEVIVTGRSEQAPAELGSLGYLGVDFSNKACTLRFCEEVAAMGDLDIVINNAGINHIDRIEDYPEDCFEEVMAVNYAAVYRVSQAAARSMLASGLKGRIVNIGSIWATNTREGRSAYSASKAGVAGMSRAIATDLASKGILVNTLSPGFVLTELTERTMGPEGIAEVPSQIPAGRLADPAEIAEVVAFLASSNNTYLTGQNIIVDGGFTNV